MPLPLARAATTCESARPSSSAADAPVWLRYWHLASLDAPTVAVVWTLSFARTAGVRLPLWVPVLVALGTWCVYVGDRVLDATRALTSGGIESLRERHFFHWRHRRALVAISGLAGVVAASIIFSQMPATIREHDSVLALAALAYFSGVHAPGSRPKWVARLWSKELLVGVLFTVGCALPTLTRLSGAMSGRDSVALLLAMSLFAALAWLNCAAIDHWESGERSRMTLPGGLICAGSVVAAFMCVWFGLRISLLCAACAGSALLLAWLDGKREELTPLTLRCAADLVLLTPIVCWVR